MLNALSNHKSKLALAGIIAPPMDLGQVVILGLLEPEFNQWTMMMSVLGGADPALGAALSHDLD